MGRTSPTAHLPNTIPKLSHVRRWLVGFLTFLLAFVAVTVWGQVILRAANWRKARFTQQAADEKAAREAWEAAAKKVDSRDRPALFRVLAAYGSPVTRRAFPGPTPQQQKQIIARNRPALLALRAALPLPYRPAQPTAQPNGSRVTTNFRPLFYLVLAEADQHARENDFSSAIDCCLDAMQFGQTLRRGGALDTVMFSNTFDQQARKVAWGLLPSLDAQTARRAARRLEVMGASDDVWYENALHEEQTLGDDALTAAFRDPKKLQQAQRNARISAMFAAMMQPQNGLRGAFNARAIYSSSNSTSTPLPTLYNRGMQKWEEWKARQSFEWTMGAYCVDAHQSFQMWRNRTLQAQAVAASAAQSGRGSTASMGFAAMQMPQQSPYTAYTSYGSPGMIELAQSQITETQTGSRLLRVAYALAAYRQEHNGRDPNALSDLVPAYLSRIPNDPYAFPVAPLAYKSPAQNASLSNERGTLYSVGPDGVDDGGVAPQGSIRRFGMGYYYSGAFSQAIGNGDMVAGKNAP